MIKAVLFDFDGVLTLDETGSQSICNYISVVTGIDNALIKSEYKKYNLGLLRGKYTHRDIWGRFCLGIGRSLDYGILNDSFINTPINPKMLRLIKHIKGNGYKTGLVTENKVDRIDAIIKHHGWESLFDSIAISAEIGSGKDNSAIFNYIIENLNVLPEECVFTDNKAENLLAPLKMGINTVYFDHDKNDFFTFVMELTDLGVEISIPAAQV